MRKDFCNTCAHYRQHYAINKGQIFRVYCGHCTLIKARRKKPDSPVCADYLPTDPDEAAFATKEYLSKALLDYMLRLDLLPQIQDSYADGTGCTQQDSELL